MNAMTDGERTLRFNHIGGPKDLTIGSIRRGLTKNGLWTAKKGWAFQRRFESFRDQICRELWKAIIVEGDDEEALARGEGNMPEHWQCNVNLYGPQHDLPWHKDDVIGTPTFFNGSATVAIYRKGTRLPKRGLMISNLTGEYGNDHEIVVITGKHYSENNHRIEKISHLNAEEPSEDRLSFNFRFVRPSVWNEISEHRFPRFSHAGLDANTVQAKAIMAA